MLTKHIRGKNVYLDTKIKRKKEKSKLLVI
jgi:hypothetical protein